MKINKAIGPDGELLFYYVETDLGTTVGNFHSNASPFEGDTEIDLPKAKEYAQLFAAAPKLLLACKEASEHIRAVTKESKSLDPDKLQHLYMALDKLTHAIYESRKAD